MAKIDSRKGINVTVLLLSIITISIVGVFLLGRDYTGLIPAIITSAVTIILILLIIRNDVFTKSKKDDDALDYIGLIFGIIGVILSTITSIGLFTGRLLTFFSSNAGWFLIATAVFLSLLLVKELRK